jgi:hypothetical protein
MALGLLIALMSATVSRWGSPAAVVCPPHYVPCRAFLEFWLPLQSSWNDAMPPQVDEILNATREAVNPLVGPAGERWFNDYLGVLLFVVGALAFLYGLSLLLRRVIRSGRRRASERRTAQPVVAATPREQALRRWFAVDAPSFTRSVVYLVAAAVLAFAALVLGGDPYLLCNVAPWICQSPEVADLIAAYLPAAFWIAAAFFGLIGLFHGLRTARARAQIPSDRQVQAWLAESLKRLEEEALRALGLTRSEIVSAPLLIMSEILEPELDMEFTAADIQYKVAHDGTLFFSVYFVTLIFFTQRHMAIFQCDFNFVEDESIDEDTYESHYEDMVVLSTTQKSFTDLKTKDRVKWAEQFNISFPSGQSIPIWVSNDQIFVITGGDKLPATDAERAISVIRSKLRDVKHPVA